MAVGIPIRGVVYVSVPTEFRDPQVSSAQQAASVFLNPNSWERNNIAYGKWKTVRKMLELASLLFLIPVNERLWTHSWQPRLNYHEPNKYREKPCPLYIIFLDSKKTFDCARQKLIWYVLGQNLALGEMHRVEVLSRNSKSKVGRIAWCLYRCSSRKRLSATPFCTFNGHCHAGHPASSDMYILIDRKVAPIVEKLQEGRLRCMVT